MVVRRRFSRLRRRRRIPRKRVRFAKRVLRATRRKSRKIQARKRRNKQYLYTYAHAIHLEATFGAIRNLDDSTSNTLSGLYSTADVDEIFQQVKVADDLAWSGSTTAGGAQIKFTRHNLTVRSKAEKQYLISNGNAAGAVFVQAFICRPRHDIPLTGLGKSSDTQPGSLIENNLNSAFVPDYNDGASLTVSAAGTGGVTNIMQNAYSTTKPTVATTNLSITPFMVPEFTKNFKVIGTKKFYLPPGATTMFKVKARALLDRKNRVAGTGLNTYFDRNSRLVFFRFFGQPVHNQTGHTAVNLGKATLDIVMTKKYWFSHSARPMPSYFLGSDNLGTVTAATLPGETEQPVGETD